MSRNSSTTRSGGSFGEATIEAVWKKAPVAYGLDTMRYDACGAAMTRHRYGDRLSPYGWEIDHIKPVALGGTDDLSNLQPLQWQNNVHKADNWPHWTCRVRG